MRSISPRVLLFVFVHAFATAASAGRILVIDTSPGEQYADPSRETRQLRDELAMVEDEKEVTAVKTDVDFLSLTETERNETAAALCIENEADAAIWLEKSENAIIGVGVVAVNTTGKVARKIAFETPMGSLTDVALLTMELVAHTETFARSAAPDDTGWIPLPSEDPPDEPVPSEPTETPENPNPPLGAIRDAERPWAPPPGTLSDRGRNIAQIALRLAFAQGIAGYEGPATWLGGKIEGGGYPTERLLLTASFSAEAGPRLRQDADRIIGYRLRPALGVGLVFTPGKILLSATVDGVLSYTALTTELSGYIRTADSWWSFVPTAGVRIGAPTGTPVSFEFEIQLAFETNGKRLTRETDTGAVLFYESPILSLQLAAGIAWSFSKSQQ